MRTGWDIEMDKSERGGYSERKIREEAPDKTNAEALMYIKKLNDKFAAARINLRMDGVEPDYRNLLKNPCITLFPTKQNVWEDLAITYGATKICNYDGIPTWMTAIEAVEKHFNKKIRYY